MNDADVLRIIVSLVFILMVILAGAWILRRSGLGRGSGTHALRVIASRNLGNRAWVAIVEVEDARLVLGVTGQQINLLHTLPPGPAPAAGERDPSDAADTHRFTTAFARALKRR